MEVPVVKRQSRPQSQHGLEEVQSLVIIPGEIIRLELLVPAKQGV